MSWNENNYINAAKCATDVEYSGAVKLTINWHEYIVPRTVLYQLVPLLSAMRTLNSKKELEMVSFSVSEAPDITFEQMKIKATEEVKDTIGKELEQKTKWWLDERSKTTQLEKELKEAREKLSSVNGVLNPKPDDEILF